MILHTVSEHLARVPSPERGEPVIGLDQVAVRYRVPHERIGSFKEYAIRRLQGRIDHHEFWALRDVTLQIGQGEVFGVIGRNGAGKSTLLKVISRVLRPTRGRVWIRGKVAPLLELGAGFHPELTGRENVYLNGTLLDHSQREITERLPEILDFAGLNEFIDAPLRMYSSGMVARLGFAVAMAWKPDVLLLDEILAVGDGTFRRKCTERINSFCEQGTTVLLVTHDLTAAQTLCRQAVWIDEGKVQCAGPSADVVRAYEQWQTLFSRGPKTQEVAMADTNDERMGDLPAWECHRFVYVFALPKSASRFLCSALVAAQPDETAIPLEAPPAPLDDPGYLATMEVSPYFMSGRPGGLYHSHAAALPVNAAILREMNVPAIVIVRHPADHLAALYCHLRGLLIGIGEAREGPPERTRPEAQAALDRARAAPSHWHSVIRPVAKEAFLDGVSVEDSLLHLIEDGYLVSALAWVCDWLWQAEDGPFKMVRYEDLIASPRAVLEACYAFTLDGTPKPLPEKMSVPEPADPRAYPHGYSGTAGIWCAYFRSPRVRSAYDRVVRNFLKLYPSAQALRGAYPDLLLSKPAV